MKQIKNRRIQPRRLFNIAAALLICGVGMICQPAKLSAQKSAPKSVSTLVAVVSRAGAIEGEGNVDAVVLVENGKLRQPYPEDNEAVQRQFASEHFATGKKYRLTFGGGEVGSVTIKSFDMGCNNIHAKALMEDNGKIGPTLSGLATSADFPGRKPSSRRQLTHAEFLGVMPLVAQIYRSRGTPLAVLHTLVTMNLVATDLDGDGKFEVIGNFVTQTKTKGRRDLLLIAEATGKTRLPFPGRPLVSVFKPALIKYQSYKLPPEGFDSSIDFVDQLDLDDDGVAEVFVLQHGFDAYSYAIYKKVRGTWREVYATTGDAC
jgi:hypothetical protein